MNTCYRNHEREKRRKYEQRVCEVEHASFVPLVMSCTGGAGPCATVFLRRLAALLSDKHHSNYSTVMELLRVRISFALLRSSIVSPQQQVVNSSPKTNRCGSCRPCRDRGSGRTGLITDLRSAYYYYIYLHIYL